MRLAVSIRARPIDRAILKRGQGSTSEVVFQSAPDQLIGRYPRRRRRTGCGWPFQSAPDQLIGRYRAGAADGQAARVVSIRARPIDRAIHRCRVSAAGRRAVSIRARPIDRAIRGTARTMLIAWEFQSAPDQLIGRYPSPPPRKPRTSSFNPRPTN